MSEVKSLKEELGIYDPMSTMTGKKERYQYEISQLEDEILNYESRIEQKKQYIEMFNAAIMECDEAITKLQ